MKYRVIAAIELGGGIGHAGKLPFSLRKDLAYFWRQVAGGVAIGTRKSVNQMGLPRHDTRIWGVSRSDATGRHWQHRFSTWQQAVRSANQQGITPWIVGGEWLYQETLAGACELYLTRVLQTYPSDRFFPKEWPSMFPTLVSSHPDSEKGVPFVYEVRQP